MENEHFTCKREEIGIFAFIFLRETSKNFIL